MRHPATQAILAHWNDVRGTRPLPRRLEIQPACIGTFLLDTFILERSDRSAFRFRLAGTRVGARFGADLKARDFLSCWGEADRALLAPHLESISELGRIGLFTGEAVRADGAAPRPGPARQEFEMIVLPLLHTGHEIDRLLCHLAPLGDAGAAPGAPIGRLRLLAAETIWPDGAADRPAAESDRQLPLAPHVRTARIVRQGRRQFRVYEGGLAAAPRDTAQSL